VATIQKKGTTMTRATNHHAGDAQHQENFHAGIPPVRSVRAGCGVPWANLLPVPGGRSLKTVITSSMSGA